MRAHDTFVIEEGAAPVVFSTSPDSPAAPYLVERRPSSLDDMYELGIIPSSVERDHLHEARELAQRISLPDAVFVDEAGRWFGDRAIPGIVPVPHEYAIAAETIRRTSRHLEHRGYDSTEAMLIARKAVSFLAPTTLGSPVWRTVEFPGLDLDVRGILYVSRKIHGLTARNVRFRHTGWIVPEGSHFMLTCDRIQGDPKPPDWQSMVWQEMAGIGPDPGPIEHWTDRLGIDEIRQRAQAVSQGWR
ncbi:hypothetical protein ACQPW1_21440 [Nocardia sp. CA-128927]|uniref:hypothetical protein n=1 Tax=Nocardia sp. CA-128927 TaxID=3239975 RepID=UPI003D97F035